MEHVADVDVTFVLKAKRPDNLGWTIFIETSPY